MRLRAHLVQLVLAVLVPVLVFFVVILVLFARAEQRVVEQGLRDTARTLAVAVDRELESTVATLEALAASEAIATGDLATLYRQMQRVQPTQPGWRSIVLFDEHGRQLLDLRRPVGAPLPDAGDRAFFQEARERGAPAVSGLLAGPDPGERSVVVVVPVLHDGRFAGALGASLDPSTFDRTLAHGERAGPGIVTLIDREHVVVARTRDPGRLVGRRTSDFAASEMARAREGFLRGANSDGVDSYGAFARNDTAGWTVVVGVPAAVVEAPLVRSLWGFGLGALGSVAIAVLLALLFGRRIAAPIMALSASADRIGRGQPPAVAPSQVVEVAEVGRAIDQASVLLRQHDLQRERAAAELRASKQILEALVWASPLAIMMVDAAGVVRMWNPACERMFGWSAEEVLGRFMPAVPEERRAEFIASIADTLAGQPSRGVEAHRRRRDGRPIDVRLFSAPLHDAGGWAAYVLSLVDDVTDRRRAERQRAAQAEVSRALTEAASIPEAGGRALEAIGRHLDWAVGSLWMVDTAADAIRCAEVWTASPEFQEFAAATRATAFGRGDGMPGRVWERGGPAWIEDLSRDENFPRRPVAESAGLRSAFGFPIVVGGRTLGVFEFFSPEPRGQDAELLELMTSLGAQIGLFVERRRADEERARLLDVERAVRTQAETATAELRRLQAITEAALAPLTVDDLLRELLVRVRAVLGVDTAAVFMLDREHDHLVLRAADGLEAGVDREPIPLGKGFVGRVALGIGAVVAEDIQGLSLLSPFLEKRGIRSLAAAPLVVAGRTTGVIRVGSRRPRGFSDDDGRLLQLVADRAALAIDNAHLYEAERHARTEAEGTSRAKDQFLAMLAHELRNPLAPIRAAIDVIGRLGTGDATVRRASEIVERQVGHLTRLLDDLLDVARITSGKIHLVKGPVDVRTAVDQALEAARPLLASKAHTLTVELAPEPLPVEADQTRLVQVIGNLLNNAAKYTPPGGAIHVSAGLEDGVVTLRIRDSGVGIPAEMLDRVFELFAQIAPSVARTEGGLGIGLTLVRRLVELHGGTVTAHSAGRNRGSEFVVRLPLGGAAPAPPAARPA
ncbi:MAG: GAF domain-containing protein, partial [Candidatus Rokuibacteriota bacterium]